MKPLLFSLVVALDFIAVWGLFKLIFGNWSRFGRCVYYYFKPDWLSHLDGDCYEDSISEGCLFLYFGILGLMFWGEAAYFF
ncbi:MAG: hypothetical protein U0931_33295 [Vulcanimicrobiota bacterium]